MVNIAVMGYGVVGSGVVEVIRKNSVSISKKAGQEIRVKKYWISGIFRTVLNGICLQRILMKFLMTRQ